MLLFIVLAFGAIPNPESESKDESEFDSGFGIIM